MPLRETSLTNNTVTAFRKDESFKGSYRVTIFDQNDKNVWYWEHGRVPCVMSRKKFFNTYALTQQ